MASIRTSVSLGSVQHIEKIHQKEVEDLKFEVDDLKQENQCLRKCLTAASPKDEQIAVFELELNDNKRKIEAEIKKLKDDFKRIESYNKGAGDANEFNQLQKKNFELEARNEELESRVKTYEDKLKEIEKGKMELEIASDTDLKAIITNLKRTNWHLQNQLKAALKFCNEAMGMEEKMHALNKKFEKQQIEKQELESIVEAQKKKQNDLIENLDNCVSTNSSEKYELESELQKKKLIIAELEENMKCVKYELQLYKEINGTKKEWLDQIRVLESHKTHLEATVAKMNRDQDELSDQLDRTIRENTIREIELQTENTKLTAKIKELENTIKKLENQLKKIQNNLAFNPQSEAQKIADLELEVLNLELERNSLLDEKENSEEENGILQKKVADLQKDYSQLKIATKKIITATYNEFKKSKSIEKLSDNEAGDN